MKEKISYSQFTFTIICYIQSFALLTSFVFSVSGKDAWFSVLLGGVMAALLFLMQIYIVKQFPGKNLIQINICVFGNVLGRVISVFYLFYFFSLASLNTRDMGDFVHSSILTSTPTVATMILFLSVCAWAVIKGLKVIVRYSAAFTMIGFASFIITTIFIWTLIDWHNLLPALSTPPQKLLQGANLITTIPFGTVIYQMLAGSVENGKHLTRSCMKGFVIGGLFLMAVIIRDTTILGNMVKVLSIPSYAVMRLANFTDAFQGMDAIFASMLVMLEFFKVSLLYYIVVYGVAELFGLDSYKPLVYTFGTLIMVFARIVYPSMMEHSLAAQATTPLIWLLFELVLPGLTMLRIAVVKKKEGKRRMKAI